AAGPVAPTEPPAAVKPVGAEAERRAAETAQVRTALGEIAALAKAGKSAEAHEKAAALVRERPNDLTVQAQSAVQGTDARRADAASARQDKERGIAAGLNSVERAAIMPSEDLTIPKEFRERTAKRKADTAPTAAELKILQALNTSVEARFKDSRLQ